ncbi:aminoacyl-tRNA hydrolase [Angustibacter sp. McL0619]|uniref:aminoacyl-tRNA hydrolase n=1 Tax=Angustibacter sp. McL0619 TaxID=3415676 RepID=UPI003CF1159E
MSTDHTWLVVGLGNPGPDYAGHRHNVGAMVLDVLGARVGGSFKSHKARAAVLEGRLGVMPGGAPGPRAVLAKPSTYMNQSGGPVAGLSQFYKVDPAQVVVVHDELDIPYGEIRLKLGGGEGGHNGLRSVTRSLGTKDYLRVRVGIGRPPGRMDAADYVLRDFSATERKDLAVLLEEAADAGEMLVREGLLASQNHWHA